jgi:hypothetical protein
VTGGLDRPVPAPPGGGVPHRGWLGWLGTYDGVVLVAVALLPLAVLLAWVLARRRRVAGSTRARAWQTAVIEVGLVYGTLPWVCLTLLPGGEAGLVPGRVSLVPLRDLATMGTFQVVGNLLIFAALGLLGPLRFAALASVPRVLAVAAVGSTLIETAQYVFCLDRVSSIDDVLLNTAGAGVAALVSRPWGRGAAADAARAREADADVPGMLT